MELHTVKHNEKCDKSNRWCNCFINYFIKCHNPLAQQDISLTKEVIRVIKSALDCEHNYKMAILEGANQYTLHYLKSQLDDTVKVYQDLFVHETCGVSIFLQTQIRDMYKKTVTKKICTVCLEEIDVDALKIGKCGHMFHDECIKRWVINKKKAICPSCCGDF